MNYEEEIIELIQQDEQINLLFNTKDLTNLSLAWELNKSIDIRNTYLSKLSKIYHLSIVNNKFTFIGNEGKYIAHFQYSDVLFFPNFLEDLEITSLLVMKVDLKEIPFKLFPKLKVLDIIDCTVKEIGSNIALSPLLESINLHNSNTEKISSEIKFLKNLNRLGITKPSKLFKVEGFIYEIENLTNLDLYGIDTLTNIPDDIENLKQLGLLDICNCSNLTEVSNRLLNMSKLTYLFIKNSTKLKTNLDFLKEHKNFAEDDVFKDNLLNSKNKNLWNNYSLYF